MDVRLVVEQGKKRKAFTLPSSSAIIGRARGNTVRIPSAEVSRRHCRLRVQDGLVTVEDLDSVNGTFLNGALVEGKQIVGPGDRLEIGPVTFVVEYELTPDALDRLRGEVAQIEQEFDVLEEVEDVVEDFEDVKPVGHEAESLADALARLEAHPDQGALAEALAQLEAEPMPVEEVLPDEEEAPKNTADPELAAVAGDEINLDLSFIDEPWDVPAGGDLRDILAQMDEEAPPPKADKEKRNKF